MAPRNNKTSLTGGNETLRHFTHPHVLIKEALDQTLYTSNMFGCDCCGMNGSGVRYNCKQCSFDIHIDCATCPEYVTSNFHLNHQLERVWEGLEKDYDLLRPCSVCGGQVKGLFYRGSSGASEKSNDEDGDHNFFIHPTCSKLPSQVILKLQSLSAVPDAPCAICGNLVSSTSSPWSYRTDSPCGLNIHPQCVTLPCVSSGISGSAQQQGADAQVNLTDLMTAMFAFCMDLATAASSSSNSGDPPSNVNVHPQNFTLPHNNYQVDGRASLSIQQQVEAVEHASELEDRLAASMLRSKMAAKHRKFMLKMI